MMTAQLKIRARILVVEDDAIVAQDIREALSELGHAVVDVVRSGEAAVRATRKHAPDLVLMDIRMPGPLDGIDAARRIRAGGDVPVVYLTAHSDARTLARARETRPRGYLLKPFDRDELMAAVEIAVAAEDRESGDAWALHGLPGESGLALESGATPGENAEEPQTPVNLSDLVESVHAGLADRMGPGRDLFVSVSGGPYFVRGRPSELDEAVRMLVMGARDSLPGGGRVNLRLEAADPRSLRRLREGRPTGDWLELSLSVEGHAADSARLEGRRGARREEMESGEDPRIATIYRVVRSHGGHVRITTEAPGRAVVQLYLPRSGADPTEA